MPEYERQHWLPASYLKFFAIDGDVRGRKSRVWVTDGETKAIERVANVAVSSWTYSQVNAKVAEQSLEEMERDYPKLLERVTTRPRIGRRDRLLLVGQMVELHFRNAKYEIANGNERFDVYPGWGGRFLEDMAGFTNDNGPEDLQALADGLAARWTVAVIANPGGDLMTCDNPSFLHTDTAGRLAFGLLPLAPGHLAVCYRMDAVSLRSTSMTSDDAKRINGVMAAQCIASMIASYEPEDDELTAVRRLRKRYGQRPWMHVEAIQPGFWRDYEPLPSFIEFI